ncbi:right-handed parallel beta-helix repeat-containing protein [Sandaracinobacter sp. RS1-74]|uniref:right-handed parallel beta-helix repeat-containing protein n=1 Tax=Sandaracinobacteroides sayramensis TaxID=2913411 RepID=UPI001EDC29A9|nr:right-handed parallel beta-helix repeat-containing protein [Sandaracinobacteroides sayramensis]MCG2841765.1 right-handed parallel beta-helix repeat-containing protein [Sandaracinobacteroides sayramensis]
MSSVQFLLEDARSRVSTLLAVEDSSTAGKTAERGTASFGAGAAVTGGSAALARSLADRLPASTQATVSASRLPQVATVAPAAGTAAPANTALPVAALPAAPAPAIALPAAPAPAILAPTILAPTVTSPAVAASAQPAASAAPAVVVAPAASSPAPSSLVLSSPALSSAASVSAVSSLPAAGITAELPAATATLVPVSTSPVTVVETAVVAGVASVVEGVKEVVSSAVATVSGIGGALVDMVVAALGGDSGVSGPLLSREQLQSAIRVGAEPGKLTPETPPSGGNGDELTNEDDLSAAPEPEAEPDEVGVIGGNGTTYYVDYAAGDNGNSGKSPDKPWKHAPGDSLATGAAASVSLKPGDTVRFKAGVAYRGSIALKHSGSEGNPIIYTGTGFGSGQAIWDGADEVSSSVPCPSQSACGGAANWSSLRLVTFAEPETEHRKLFDAQGALFEPQSPGQSDPFWGANIDQYAVIPVAKAAAMTEGRLEDAALAAAARNEPNARLLLWVYGNKVVERTIDSISGNTLYFDGKGLVPYTNRDSKAAIVGAVKSVNKPGLYAIIAPGKAIVYPRSAGASQYYVGKGRSAFNLRGQSNITVHGFQFVRGTASRGTTREGVVVANYSGAVSNIRIESNRFQNFSMQNGYGMVMLNNVTNLVIRGNRLEDLEGASGFRLGSKVFNLTVENNRLRKMGRTGIFLGGVTGGVVRSNILSEFLGVHGNAMSYYEANKSVDVTGNCVFNSSRPMTFHGDGSGGNTVNNIRFADNIFVTSADGTSAVYSWGSGMRGVVLENNLALGRKAGFILNSGDKEVTATRNRTSRLLINGSKTTPAGWLIQNNDDSAELGDAANASLAMNGCTAQSPSGVLAVG